LNSGDSVNRTCSLQNELDKIISCNLDKEIVIICIGTDRSTGDSFGPHVGTLLT